MKTHYRRFVIIVLLLAISLYIALPSQIEVTLPSPLNINREIVKRPIDFSILGRRIYFNPQVKLGLDLQGGTQLTLDANMSELDETDRMDALESAREIIARRIDLFGVSEPVIQTSVNQEANQYRLLVELPGVTDTAEAVSLIGQTARLEFKEQDESLISPESTQSAFEYFNSFVPTQLTGEHLERASVQFDPQTGQPVVGLEFTDAGTELFAQITEANVGGVVGIFLDDYPLTLPTVQVPITDGQAIITGSFSTEQAKNLAIQLNAGALPVPIEVIGQTQVSASLGEQAVDQSLVAGLIGLGMVAVFMILLYGWLGFLAVLALAAYGIITLALYKLLGITLTLPGMAGFILSVGMAVDSNILIFERFKEEMRQNKKWRVAMEMAFGRAWDSIKDANVATLVITFILFNPFNWTFFNTSGMVRGFAVTLALGIFVSLFTGIIVTRTLIRLFYKGKDDDAA